MTKNNELYYKTDMQETSHTLRGRLAAHGVIPKHIHPQPTLQGTDFRIEFDTMAAAQLGEAILGIRTEAAELMNEPEGEMPTGEEQA